MVTANPEGSATEIEAWRHLCKTYYNVAPRGKECFVLKTAILKRGQKQVFTTRGEYMYNPCLFTALIAFVVGPCMSACSQEPHEGFQGPVRIDWLALSTRQRAQVE